MDKGEDFIVERDLATLVKRMNALVGGEPLLDLARVEREIVARDRATRQSRMARTGRSWRSAPRAIISATSLFRTVKPHRLLDPAAGPLIAVRLNILTRKTLGGLADRSRQPRARRRRPAVPGLYAAGEVGGLRRRRRSRLRALEGTFLGGCIFSGRVAGRARGGRSLVPDCHVFLVFAGSPLRLTACRLHQALSGNSRRNSSSPDGVRQ